MKPTQITSGFRSFVKDFDPELAKVTPMVMRASYATMMLQKFRKKQAFKEKTETEFVAYLSKTMNTSPEQLASTYAACDIHDYEGCAKQITEALAGNCMDHNQEGFTNGNELLENGEENSSWQDSDVGGMRCNSRIQKDFNSIWS